MSALCPNIKRTMDVFILAHLALHCETFRILSTGFNKDDISQKVSHLLYCNTLQDKQMGSVVRRAGDHDSVAIGCLIFVVNPTNCS